MDAPVRLPLFSCLGEWENELEGAMLIRAGLGGTEREDWEEKYDQLPSHAAVSEDQGTDQAGQMKRQDKRAHIGRELIVSTETGFPDG